MAVKGDGGMTIGESIRHHRKRLNLTQAELADRVGVTAQAVSKWENDTGLPDITMAVPLARALGTTTDELLRFGERRQYFEELWHTTMRKSGDDPTQLLAVCELALKEFPWDWQFLYRAALDETRLAETVTDPEHSLDYIGRALAHAQLYYEMDPDSSVARNLLQSLRAKVEVKDGFFVLKKKK